MARKIVECIPNFSEGRDQVVIGGLLKEINSVNGVRVLDQHADHDHNRTVITFLGGPEQVEEAAFLVIKKAAELIDMDQHSGEHPRIGATDVVPFVPIQGMTVTECVQMAERLGKRVADELDIPVYLYEDAARMPERKNLEKVRKGQYEGLKVDILSDPARKPDFGPAKLGKAGATVIGARAPLIAFNVYLNTDDTFIAKKIARTVRFSSGGLRFVKAMGVLVDGQAQVSMNLTNFNKTAISQVVELIRREAERHGVQVHHSELVGLIPQKALIDSAVWYLQLDQFEGDQILESKLDEREGNADYTFLDAIASSDPTPGGGSAAAYTGASAAALVAMVARLTIGKKKYAQVEAEMNVLQADADELRADLTALIKRDADAFNEVMAAFRLSKDTADQKAQRSKAIQDATYQAALVPLETCEKALTVLQLAVTAAEKGNLNAITDAGSGASLAVAAVTCAGANVKINLQSLKDKEKVAQLTGRLAGIEAETRELQVRVREIIASRADITLL